MKIDKKELELILNQRNQIEILTNKIANAELQKTHLINSYSKLIDESNEARKKLEEKYGSISIDLSDGSYTIIENESK